MVNASLANFLAAESVEALLRLNQFKLMAPAIKTAHPLPANRRGKESIARSNSTSTREP